MKYAQVLEVYLNDDAENGPYSIQALLKESTSSQRIVAKPLNIGDVRLPVVGEYVAIQRGPSEFTSAFGSGRRTYYYTTPVAIQSNINNNILENASRLEGSNTGGDYGTTSLGIPNSSISSPSDKKNKEFKEVSKLSQLQPYAGDSLLQGRFGQSIRFGYTPKNADSKNQPNWSSTSNESPITILRNSTVLDGYNKFVIEDINDDDSSIWMGSRQVIGLKPAHPFSLTTNPQSSYSNPQIVINSDRVVINSKSDSVLISGKRSVNVSTSNWKADMDTMFNQIEALKNQIQAINNALIPLASGLTAIPLTTAVGTPLTNATTRITTELVKITTQLELMKQ